MLDIAIDDGDKYFFLSLSLALRPCRLIGLIWAIPLGLIAMGIVYHNIFGVSSIAVEPA